MVALAGHVANVVSGAGGPTNRRRQKAGPLAINAGDEAPTSAAKVADETPAAGGEPDREGRNLQNVFPFVGGERGRC